VDRDERGGRDVAVGELLEDDRGVEPAQRRAAHILADIEPREPKLGGLPQHVDREMLLLVPAGRMRGELGGGEGAGGVFDGPLVVG
jgi:hypothetical protein